LHGFSIGFGDSSDVSITEFIGHCCFDGVFDGAFDEAFDGAFDEAFDGAFDGEIDILSIFSITGENKKLYFKGFGIYILFYIIFLQN
jgi:hypothetical protein